MSDLDLSLPAFMVRERVPGVMYTAVQREPARPWVMPGLPARHLTPGAKDFLGRTVAAAVSNGADTWGKIAKALPSIDTKRLRKGLKLAIRLHLVEKNGRRYKRTVTP